MGHRLERPALGQKVPLGTLYNARTDTFLDLSIFSENPSGIGINKIHLQKSTTTTSRADTYQGRLELLETGNELGASLFCDVAEAGGAGRCLNENPVSSRPGTLQHYAALCHNVLSLEEKLVPNSKDLKSYLDPSVPIDKAEATHVLIGIVWGCKTVITVRATSQLDSKVTDDATAAKAEDLHRHFENAFLDFTKAVESLQYFSHPELETVQDKGTTFRINAYSEVFDGDGTALENLQEALNLIHLIPALLEHRGVNDEKGEPVLYCLLPIQMMAAFLGLCGKEGDAFRANTNAIPPAPSDAIGEVLDQFSQLSSVNRYLVQFSDLLSNHRQYFEPKLINDILRANGDIRVCEADRQQEFSLLLSKLRLQGASREALRTLTIKIAKNAEDGLQLFTTGRELEAKICFLRQLVADGAIYIGHNGVDVNKVLKSTARSGHHTYVLHYGDTVSQEDPKGWNANIALLKELLHRKGTVPKTDVVIFLDYDASNQHLDRGRIEHFGPRGVLLAQDLLEKRLFIASQSLARYNPKDLENSDGINKPVKRRMVKIPCPGIRCSDLAVCQWMCSECHSHIEFGYTDDYLYCECGRVKYDAWRFRCNSPNHDRGRAAKNSSNDTILHSNRTRVDGGFVLFKNKAQLLAKLHSLDQTDYVNILILGETGVGKSTFINSFVNYLAYETLDEAKASEKLSWVVPCSFSIQTMDRSCPNGAIKESKVQVGGRDDENDGSTGASATQKTTVYPVNIGDKTIRLIDTPGIGDTRGLAYDKKNMADILQTLSSYEHLHGILILLKSNNSRLTVTFNFCMQELLTHLHRSASSNMAFGFTNTRISNYSPGDTFGPLTALLDKHRDIGLVLENQNTYCFDSESFRYLAAFKSDIIMENEEDFRRSWEHSRDETVRLIDFFQSRTPHQVKSTLSMNGTRRLIAELTKPMADISQIIGTNIKVLNDRHAELGDTQLSGDKLRQRLQIPKLHLRAIKLERPRTVCRNIKCVDWRDDGTGEVKRVYKSPCHNPCYLHGVEVDRVNCPDLLNCWAFADNNGFCIQSICGHSWQEHLHVCYELEEYSAMVTDTEAQRLYDENASDIVVKTAALEASSALINVYRDEHSQIQKAAARFCVFLKRHSITPYNDATLEYLDMLIDEEKQKALVSRDKTKLEDLQASYASHVELVNALETGMSDDEIADGQLDETAVGALVHDLYSLPHFGSMLRNVKEDTTAAHEATYRERPFKVPTSRRRGEAFRSGQDSKEPATGQINDDTPQIGSKWKKAAMGTSFRDKLTSFFRVQISGR